MHSISLTIVHESALAGNLHTILFWKNCRTWLDNLSKDNNILLLRRFNTGYEDGNYSVVAGHLDGEETVKEAAIREVKEEAGVEVSEKNVQIVSVMHRKAGDERVDFFAVVNDWQGEIQNLEPHKCDDLRFFPLNDLPSNVIPYISRAINNYKENRWFDSFGWNEKKIVQHS